MLMINFNIHNTQRINTYLVLFLTAFFFSSVSVVNNIFLPD